VEFKNVDYGYFKDNWILEDDEVVGLPLQYNLQLQHQLGAAESEYGYIVACVGGNKLFRGRIYRHEPTQQRIAEAIEAFWTAVGEGREPAEYADFKTVASMLAFGEKEKTVDLTAVADIDVDQAIRKYLRLDGVIKRLEKRLDHRKAAFARFITDECTRAITQEFNISWPSYTRPAGMSEPKYVESATWRMGLRVSKKKPPKEAKVKKAKASEAAMIPAATE
jgi:predicted phage-related endonuclease